MAKTIYRIGKDIYDAGTNQRIADPATLQRDYAGATDLGQKPAGFTAINGAKFNTKETQQANFNDIQPIGNTLYGVPKTPTSTDIKTGIDLAGIKPPEPVFNSVYDVYTQGATKTSEQMNNDLMKWYEQEKTKKDAEIAQLKSEQEATNKLREENLKKASEIGQKSTDELAKDNQMLADFTSSINMKEYYGELDTQYKERKAAADEYAQTVKMMNEDLTAEQNRSTLKMFSLAKQNNLKENYVAQLSMLEARINNADGNYAMAAKTLDRGISLIQTAREDLLNSYQYIDQIYKMKDEKTGADLLTATNEQKSYVSAQIEMMQGKIEKTEAEKQNIIKLLTDTQTSQTAIKAGVQITDTVEEAVKKITDYAKTNGIGKETTKTVKVGSGKTAKTYLITYDANGKETKRELVGGTTGTGTGGTGGSKTVNEKQAVTDMTNQLKTVVGPDGFISPDDYTKARNAWIGLGLSPTTFDTKFKGFRNPNNPNYVTNKTKSGRSLLISK
jgi:hypothetical protein